MEENVEKKARRPRIGESKGDTADNNESRYEKIEYNNENRSEGTSQSGDYSQNYGNQRGDYGDQRGYNQRGGYQQRGNYNNRYNNYENNDNQQDQGENGYQPRGGYNQRGGYNNQRGGYNNQRGGYNQQRGGYQQRNNQGGGYNNQRGGYNNQRGNNQGGGYNNQGNSYNQRGGYQQRGNNQGGYNNQRGNYNNQRGGYNNNQRGGYNKNAGPHRNHNQQGGRPQQMRFTPRPKRIEYELPEVDPNEPIRLNKFMANAGVCSRREADELIQKGEVKVNGVPVTELGTKITRNDVVEYNDKVVTLESKCYILLNKPKDCVTTSDDPNGRTTVMDLIKGACSERVYPVGRLDRNTTGVLLLTNDGDLASKLTHPKYVKKKIYQVWTDKPISEDDMQHIADGVELDDGPIHADAISYVSPTDKKQAGIEIHSGRNRVVRRIFESLGYHVVKLDRVYFAGLTKKNLARGKWRYLTQDEVNFLKQGSFE